MSKVALLKRVPFFSRLSEGDLGLADHLHRRTYHKGTTLFDKGSPARTLYIIESGRVRVFIPGEMGEELSVNVYGAGDVVGELCILDGRPRCASAITMADSVALTLDREDLRRCVAASPEIAFAVMEVLSARLRYSTEYAESLAFTSAGSAQAWTSTAGWPADSWSWRSTPGWSQGDCTGCANTIPTSLSRLSGVKRVKADHTSQVVEVSADVEQTDLATVREWLEELGYQTEPVS